jgi:hypothetical protein
MPQRQSIFPGIAPDIRVSRLNVSMRRAKGFPGNYRKLSEVPG